MIRKKYILTGFLLLSGIASFYSCEKYLDIAPTTALESNFFTDESRITRGVGGVYAQLANIYGPQLNENTQYGFWLLPGDDITSDGTGNSHETWSGFNASDGLADGMWRRLYQLVSRANFMLNKIADPAIANIYKTDGLKDANIGELTFLRAWADFKLWDWFRKAPLQTERITAIDSATLPPSQGFELLDFAINTLEAAAPKMYDSWDDANAGRITKDGAYGLLVKLYVTRACYNQKNADDYSKAIAAWGKISDSRKTAFASVSFGDNFDYRTENNPESLFEYQASFAPSQDNAWLDNNFGGAVGQMGAFYHYWDTHWGNYSSGIFGPTQKLVNAFDPNDPRKAETLTNTGDNMGGTLWWIPTTWDKFSGYMMVKYENGARGSMVDNTWAESSDNNPRILRLADVKLLVAEAYLATGDASEALTQVNDVRQRARNSVSPASSAPAALASVTMTDIMNERFVELAGEEGHRWSDLRRWHAAGYINLANWTAADFGFPSQYDPNLFAFDINKNLLFPIPTNEMNSNPLMSATGNNPGY